MRDHAQSLANGAGSQRRRRWGIARGAGVALLAAALGASSLALPATALAASNSSAAQVLPLTGPVTGTLQGDSGGSYAKYEFAYPGNGSVVQLRLTADAATPLDSGAAGVNVYQSGNLITTAGPDGPFADLAIFSTDTPGPITVQVFNYDPANAINFTLTPTGLPATAATGAATTAPAAQEAIAPTSAPLALNGSVTGNLRGDNGGDFAIYQIAYPGDGSPVTLTLTTDSSAPLDTGSVGVNVYQGSALLTTAQQSSPLTATAIFTSSSTTPITVQVFNYGQSGAVSYTFASQH